ncbi:MAG: zinc-binding dehydrogenase [Acidobacteriota bacterium]
MTEIPETHSQLLSTINADGTLELAVRELAVPTIGDDDVLIRVEASPINPSDLGMLFGAADMREARSEGGAVLAPVPEKLRPAMAGRLDQPMPVGNEGCGVVVAAGSSAAAQALLGKTVAILGGAMYAQYRSMAAKQCLVLPDGTDPRDGASCFVNPLTALGMTETMRLEGHTALAHTAAASNLGQMLQKICLADGIGLVNIVRRQEQVDLLKGIGAEHVCNSSEDDFEEQLTAALRATGATLAFDATGGGTLASQILSCMEKANTAEEYSRYGSTVHKQVYIYGGLDRSATTLTRNYGMAWGIGGWLLPPFLQRIGFEAAQALRERVASELQTTFKSEYSNEISLSGMLDLDNLKVYGKQATGEKFLVRPNA